MEAAPSALHYDALQPSASLFQPTFHQDLILWCPACFRCAKQLCVFRHCSAAYALARSPLERFSSIFIDSCLSRLCFLTVAEFSAVSCHLPSRQVSAWTHSRHPRQCSLVSTLRPGPPREHSQPAHRRARYCQGSHWRDTFTCSPA